MSYVYIASIEDFSEKEFIKVGACNDDVWGRIMSLQTGCPFKISLSNFYKIPNNAHFEVEKSIHKELCEFRQCGEWFVVDEESSYIIDKIKKLMKKYEREYCSEYVESTLLRIEKTFANSTEKKNVW
jgi:hypothetical protein